MRIPKLCFFLAFWLTSSALRGQEYDASCGPVRRQMAALIEREKGELPLERFSAYVHFLEAAPEEPSDCIHREMRGRIAEVEIALVGLKIKQEQYPGRVFYCGAVDNESHRCIGPEADDTALLPDAQILTEKLKLGHQLFVEVTVLKGYTGHSVEVYGGSRQLMQDGAKPILLERKGSRIGTHQLEGFPDPVIIVIWKRTEVLGLRKFVRYLEGNGQGINSKPIAVLERRPAPAAPYDPLR